MPTHPFKQIEDFLEGEKLKNTAETVFKTQNGFLCLYFDSKEEKFKGVMF